MQSNKPSFDREVLDFDYGDDDQTPPAKIPKHSMQVLFDFSSKINF